METSEIHYEMTVENDRHEWNEKISSLRTNDLDLPVPTTDEQAMENAKKTVGFFNKTLKPDELERRLLCVQRVETKVIDLMKYKS